MVTLLHRVKTKLFIHAHRRVRGMLDGEYRSLFQGRSLDFDDLRQYQPGDEIKDIDWKATARYGAPLIKRYIANRKHQVIFVVDTGRDLAAVSQSGRPKSEVAILAVGVLGYLATRHGDLVSLVAGDGGGIELLPPKGTESGLERLLQRIAQRASIEAPRSNLDDLLEYATRSIRRSSLVVVVADDDELTEHRVNLVRRLHARHEVLWLTVGDADLMRSDYTWQEMADVEDSADLPSFVRNDPQLRNEFATAVAVKTARRIDRLESLGICGQRVTGDDDVIPALFRLLERHRHARR